MKKALKAMKFGFFLCLIFVLGLIFTNAGATKAMAKKLPLTYNYSYPYYYPYFTPYFSIFFKDKNTDDHRIVVPTREQVVSAVLKLVK